MDNQTNNTEQQPKVAAVAEKNTLMAVLAYIGPLVIVSLLTSKDDPFVKFHIKQGLVLIIIAVAIWIVFGIIPFLGWAIGFLLNLVIMVLAIIGIINALKGVEKKVPVVGDLEKYLKF